MEFKILKDAVAEQFVKMQKHQLFRVSIQKLNDAGETVKDKDAIWEQYQLSFPNGSNPRFRERALHDCSCCRNFVRNIGDVVAIIEGKLVSVWDIDISKKESIYQQVADSMSEFVKSKKIGDVFAHFESTAGSKDNFEEMASGVKTWSHFFVNIKPEFVMAKKDIGTALNDARGLHDVLHRGLVELTLDSVDTIQEIIAQNSLYRGEQYSFMLTEFRKLKVDFDSLKGKKARELFSWDKCQQVHPSVAKIRNSAIGTLLIDLSAGEDLETAVKKFETSIMAPSNYKRPNALVSQAMINKAKDDIEAMGYTSALRRRQASIHDITVNNILFLSRAARKTIDTDDPFEGISATASAKSKSLDKVEEVPIETFLKKILPYAESVEVMVENSHTPNLVSLIAPDDPTARNMFKWNNNFTWSYNGEVADSIKERVKQAGGNVTGDLCCRLAWYNHDDLDLHLIEPNGNHIYFSHPSRQNLRTLGQLDVDMNAGYGTTRTPVENIFYPDRRWMLEGNYTLFVNQFMSRESSDIGFDIEIDYLGNVTKFNYAKPLRSKDNVVVARFTYTHKEGLEIVDSLPATHRSQKVWGLETGSFQKVNVIMLSPNYWDDQGVGNKHYFFMLDGCKSENKLRGFFNEFLKDDLNKHRKVFEVVGSKLAVAETDDQLSGLGFSSTQNNTLICKVKGSFSRIVKIVF